MLFASYTLSKNEKQNNYKFLIRFLQETMDLFFEGKTKEWKEEKLLEVAESMYQEMDGNYKYLYKIDFNIDYASKTYNSLTHNRFVDLIDYDVNSKGIDDAVDFSELLKELGLTNVDSTFYPLFESDAYCENDDYELGSNNPILNKGLKGEPLFFMAAEEFNHYDSSVYFYTNGTGTVYIPSNKKIDLSLLKNNLYKITDDKDHLYAFSPNNIEMSELGIHFVCEDDLFSENSDMQLDWFLYIEAPDYQVNKSTQYFPMVFKRQQYDFENLFKMGIFKHLPFEKMHRLSYDEWSVKPADSLVFYFDECELQSNMDYAGIAIEHIAKKDIECLK